MASMLIVPFSLAMAVLESIAAPAYCTCDCTGLYGFLNAFPYDFGNSHDYPPAYSQLVIEDSLQSLDRFVSEDSADLNRDNNEYVNKFGGFATRREAIDSITGSPKEKNRLSI